MIAQASSSCLNEIALLRLASGEYSSDELSRCEAHVTVCENCRALLESRALDDSWRRQLLPILQVPSEVDITQLPREMPQQSALNLLGPTDDPNMLGRIGSYEIIALVGIGGMGVVFKAFDASLNRFVAIKLMQPHLAVSGAARQRFEREGRAAAAVINDCVLPIYAVSEWQGVPYLVMQYLAGMNLQKWLESKGPLRLSEILRISLHMARGLAAAHGQGLVHRDVKPSNILLDGSVERAMLTDFGLAQAVDDASVTRTGLVAGTPQYMSPEQVRGEKVDARSDLFSLGSTMYAMCTGHSPFRGESTYSVLHRLTHDQPQPIQEVNPDFPVWLCNIISKLMSKRPSDRFQSAEEVGELLKTCLAHSQQPNIPLPKILQKSPPFKRILMAGVIAAALFASLFAGVLIMLELNRGTLVIECDTDDVPIRVMQGDQLVEKLTVSRDGKTTRVSAGTYTVEIDQAFDKAVVADGHITVSRGAKQIVKVRQTAAETSTTVDHDVAALLRNQTPLQADKTLGSLVDMIRATVNPDSWNNQDFTIQAYPANNSLMVRQTPASQNAITELLQRLRDKIARDPGEVIRSASTRQNLDPTNANSFFRDASLLENEILSNELLNSFTVQEPSKQSVPIDIDEENAFRKLFDAVATISTPSNPTPIPVKLLSDSFNFSGNHQASAEHGQDTFLFKSIENVKRTQLSNGVIVYEFDVDALAFFREVALVATGDSSVSDAVLEGMRRDRNGPQLDVRRILREDFGKRVKLICHFEAKGGLTFLVEMQIVNPESFLPKFRQFFESESRVLANETRDFYAFPPLDKADSSNHRTIGAKVINQQLYWGSYDRVVNLVRSKTEP